jgi:hypothetical protein
VLVHDRTRRLAAAGAAGAAGGCLVIVGMYFGTPGPEGYPALEAGLAAAAIALLLLTRPPDYLRTVLFASLLVCAAVAVVPNGLGSNFNRFAWICLPVAAAATARGRTWLVITATGLAASVGIAFSVRDLSVAASPESNIARYDSLIAELAHLPRIADHRVEIVPDGTHVAAFALLSHVQLARGYETQTDNALNAALASPALDATSYKIWLDNCAVGYVVLDRTTLARGPEDRLVRSGALPYLHQVWADAHWRLFRVSAPTPVVASPAVVVDADQASLTILAPRAGTFALRVRWSHFLRVSGPDGASAGVTSDGQGWTTLTVSRPGRYRVS